MENKKKLIKEHETLVKVLRSHQHSKHLKEAKKQEKELKEYKMESKLQGYHQNQKSEHNRHGLGQDGSKFNKVMHEWGAGKLKSSSGSKVKSQKQALAIAFSEQRRAKKS